jgi:hypothetical protein
MELNSPAFAPDLVTKEINKQILDLFETEASLHTFFLSSPTDSSRNFPLLKRIIIEDVWKVVKSQLESSLIAARLDRELASKSLEQASSMGTKYWGRRTPTGVTSRRSPFS